MLEFNADLLTEVKTYGHDNDVSTLSAFKSVFISYLIEAGETNVADLEIIDFKKVNDNMRLDGYAYIEYFQSLTLLVCDYCTRPELGKIGKTEIDKATRQALKFYKTCKTNYFEQLEESSSGYQAYEFVKQFQQDIETINIILITNRETVLYVPNDIMVGKVTVKFDVWDLERLHRCVFQNGVVDKIVISLKKKYDTKLSLIKVKRDNPTYDCYIGVISGYLLAKIYKDEGQKLIEKNVRSFLQATGSVNKGIKTTINDEPQMFMAYNNGISTVADEIVVDDQSSSDELAVITEIRGWQIVNGGQTTASIYNALQNKVSLELINVQIKLTVIKDVEKADEIVTNISKYANSQNKITMSDFSANDGYHIDMERWSRKTYIPIEKGKSLHRWFYERARGQYYVEMNRQPTLSMKKQFVEFNPHSRCISKTVAAKCIMSWIGYPYVVSKGLETNFVFFQEKIKDGIIPPPSEETYKDMISKVILFNECDRIIASHKFGGFKAQQNYYTLSLIGKYYADVFASANVWKNQHVSPEISLLIEEVMYKVWNHFMKPITPGVNIGQWCKKEDCWELLQRRFEENEL